MATKIFKNMFPFGDHHYWGNVTGKFRDYILQNEEIMDLNVEKYVSA